MTTGPMRTGKVATNGHLLELLVPGFPDLVLSDGADRNANDAGWTMELQGRNFSTGTPEPVEVTIRSLLMYGARVVTEGWGVRTVGFSLTIRGTSHDDLGDAEGELTRRIGRRARLRWRSSDTDAPPAVFEVETSSMGESYDDGAHLRDRARIVGYELRFVCQPWARSDFSVKVAALAPPPVESAPESRVTIDDGESPLRWSARSGRLEDGLYFLAIKGSRSPVAVWTGPAVDLSARRYVSISMFTDEKAAATQIRPLPVPPTMAGDGVPAQLVATRVDPQFPVSTIYTWLVPADPSVTRIEVTGSVDADTRSLRFRNLTASNRAPSVGSTRQSLRAFAQPGSAPTTGDVEISHATSGLGTVLLYTWAGGPQAPSLHQFRVDGGVPVADDGLVSDTADNLNTTVAFEVPVSQLIEGHHQLWARLRREGGGPSQVRWSAQIKVGGALAGSPWTGSVSVPTSTSWAVHALGDMPLPPADLPAASSAVVRVELWTATSMDLLLDEAWVFNLDVGDLSVVQAGGRRRLWVEAADVDRDRPAYYVGDTADQSDAFGAAGMVQAWGTHEMVPGLMSALVVTTGAQSAQAAFESVPAHHTRPSVIDR